MVMIVSRLTTKISAVESSNRRTKNAVGEAVDTRKTKKKVCLPGGVEAAHHVTMKTLLIAILMAIHQGGAFILGPVAAPSLLSNPVTTSVPLTVRSGGTTFRSLRSRREGAASGAGDDNEPAGEEAADVDVEGLMSSLDTTDLFGEGTGKGGGGARAGGLGGLAAAASNAVADIEDPGKLVREAAKPFRDEMDRIEAEFQKSVSEKEEEMERKLEDMLKKTMGSSGD